MTWRLLQKHAGYFILANCVLAVTLGLNLLVFTVVNALWVRPLPFPQAERVVTFPGLTFQSTDGPVFQIFDDGAAGQLVVNEMFPWRQLPHLEIAGLDHDLETLTVTPTYFKVLGLSIRGRDFTEDDDRIGAEPVVIISDRLWSRALQRRPSVVGSVLLGRPVSVRVVGVAPPGFNGARRGEDADLWIPLGLGRRIAPTASRSMMVFGRLSPGQTAAMLAQRFEQVAPDVLRLFHTTAAPLSHVFGSPGSPGLVIREGDALLLSSGLALLVLLGGCATVAALVLLHYERRRTELAVRMSLGASRQRLAVQLVRELLLVAAVGAGGGITLARLGVKVVSQFNLPGGVEIGRLDLSVDWRVGAVAVAAVVLALAAAATFPIVRATRLRAARDVLTSSSTATPGSIRVRQVLLATQVCTATAVLVAAALFVTSVTKGFGRSAGFDVDRTVFVSVQEEPSATPVGDPQRLRALQIERRARLLPVLRAVPGVVEVADGPAPIGADIVRGTPSSATIRVRDQEWRLLIGRLAGSHQLLSVLGVPVIAGRALTAADFDQVPAAAVITRSLANRLWPDGVALGETFSMPQSRGGPFVVVGICGDLPYGSLTLPVSGVVVTAGSSATRDARFVIRTAEPEMVASALSQNIRGQIVRVVTGRELVARDIDRQRLGAHVFSGFGVAALLLALGGSFGLVAYLVESRRREFGIRLALGADVAHLVRLGLRAALFPASIGVVCGLAVGAAMAQTFEAVLIGITAVEWGTYLVVATTVLVPAATAGLAASWRLRGTAPSDALRTT